MLSTVSPPLYAKGILTSVFVNGPSMAPGFLLAWQVTVVAARIRSANGMSSLPPGTAVCLRLRLRIRLGKHIPVMQVKTTLIEEPVLGAISYHHLKE